MDMYERIAKLRADKKMTLEEVANIVGVTKSTVKKWEDGSITNMKRDKIASLASALGTTPAYLMGWAKTKDSDSGTSYISLNTTLQGSISITKKESDLLQKYRKLDDISKKHVDKTIDLELERASLNNKKILHVAEQSTEYTIAAHSDKNLTKEQRDKLLEWGLLKNKENKK